MLSAFGHELSESGAAYSAVRRFVNKVITEFDCLDFKYKKEYEEFCLEMGIETDYRGNQLLDLFYGKNKQKIAGFAKHMSLNADNSEVYMQVLEEEVNELSNLVNNTY